MKNPDLAASFPGGEAPAQRDSSMKITHVRREHDAGADALGNQALDGKFRKGGGPPEPESEPAAGPSHHRPAAGPAPSDARVRPDALDVLRSAAEAWASRGKGAVPVEAVWEQLWSVLEDGGVLKKPKKK